MTRPQPDAPRVGAVWLTLPHRLARTVHCGCDAAGLCMPALSTHRLTCSGVMAALPQLMVAGDGDVLAPACPEDAAMLLSVEHASPLFPDRFFAWLNGVEGVAPVTGAPAFYEDEARPEGCVCYLKDDLDWGEHWVPPNGGCPAHPVSLPSQIGGGP